MVAIVLGSVLLITLILLFAFCIFKQRQTQRGHSVYRTDENPVYGDYNDYYHTVEVRDTNDYYFSDYEVGSGRSTIRDNNPDYVY